MLPPLRSVTNKGTRLVLSRLDVPTAFLAALLCFSAAAPPAAAQEPPSPAATDPQSQPPTAPAAQAAPAAPADQAAPAATTDAPAANKRHHALSLIGEPKYPTGFTHFDWVNPDAPKGGNWTLEDLASFVHSPKTFVPGTKMLFPGIADPGDLSDLLAYLNTLK